MSTAARRALPAWAEIGLMPLINVALALITVGIIVLAIGVDPLHALHLLVVGALGSSEAIGYTLYYATNFAFTRAVGLEMDASGYGMGVRSKRYAMVVDNGVVKALNVEKPGSFEVSSAEAVMKAL